MKNFGNCELYINMKRAFNIHASVITLCRRIFVVHYFVAYNLVPLKLRRDRKDDGFCFATPVGVCPEELWGACVFEWPSNPTNVSSKVRCSAVRWVGELARDLHSSFHPLPHKTWTGGKCPGDFFRLMFFVSPSINPLHCLPFFFFSFIISFNSCPGQQWCRRKKN